MKNAGYYRKMRLLTYAVGALVVAVMSTACGKKDEGGSVVVTPGGVNGACVGCPTATALLASATGRSYYNDELSLQFYGDSSTLTGVQPGQGSVGWYSGNVVASGVFRVRQAQNYFGGFSCNLPVGDYAVSATSPGSWNGQSFWNLELVSTSGPAVIKIRMLNSSISGATPARVDYAGAQFPFYLISMNMQIESMSGGTCQFSIVY